MAQSWPQGSQIAVNKKNCLDQTKINKDILKLFLNQEQKITKTC